MNSFLNVIPGIAEKPRKGSKYFVQNLESGSKYMMHKFPVQRESGKKKTYFRTILFVTKQQNFGPEIIFTTKSQYRYKITLFRTALFA